jgi:hypothetical protein
MGETTEQESNAEVAGQNERLVMQLITEPDQLEIGELYWLKWKYLNLTTDLARCEDGFGGKHFGNHIWATEENPLAFERWHIYGPVSEPNWDKLLVV